MKLLRLISFLRLLILIAILCSGTVIGAFAAQTYQLPQTSILRDDDDDDDEGEDDDDNDEDEDEDDDDDEEDDDKDDDDKKDPKG